MKKTKIPRKSKTEKSISERKKNVLDIAAHKTATAIGGKKIPPLVVLTAYTTPMAKILDEHVDILLVGDSLGMVLYGFESTLPVTIEMMIAHGAAVKRGAKHALVVVDMPFASYQASKEQAFESCARVLKETGCDAVKLEGGLEMEETISFLVKRGIPVMAHVGLKPQHVNRYGGYRYQGKNKEENGEIFCDIMAVQRAGAFCVVIEAVKEALIAKITRECSITTIGIGASSACDGQVLVTEDMLGLTNFEHTPRFVKKYADLAILISQAAEKYAKEVKERQFPDKQHVY